MKKRALITGIAGQDGSYLAEFLLGKGYEVHGVSRRVALEDPEHRLWRINEVLDKLVLHSASVRNPASLAKIVSEVQPDEFYHLAAQSFVSYTFDEEFTTINNNINGTLSALAAVRESAPESRFYFAGSSEMFGNPTESPQNEATPLNPRSPYGISKAAGFHLTRSYRELYGIKGCSGILFNHESPRRGFEFVTRKITSTVAKIKRGHATELRLGNLDARRDWGFAGDYVRAMWLMMQQDIPDDYVIATGEAHTVREFVELAFGRVDLDWERYVVYDERYVRPAESNPLTGDSARARNELGWTPQVRFEELVRIMVDTDLELLDSAGPSMKMDR